MTEERHHDLGIHTLEPQDHGELLRRRQVVRRAKILSAVVIALLAIGAGRTVMSRMSNASKLEEGTVEHSRLYVRVAAPKTNEAGQTLALPGTLQGYVQAPISARAGGYLKRWHKDIGSRVTKGELLAEIDAPELDQQLSQAVAARQQTASSLQLAVSTMERWEALRKKDAVSQQELDEKRSLAAQAKANLAAADANVERLRQTESFKRVVAPFSGVITRRNVDVGDLIDAGGGAARMMFVLAQTDPLRVYVNVPQAYSQLVKSGQEVTIEQSELRGQRFKGQVARTAAAIDPATRTMQIEVTLPNRDGVLLPGAYVQVLLPLAASKAMTIPTNALLIRGEGMRVAVVDAESRVHLKSVKVGRNYGENVEVMEGVAPTDKLVLNPPDSMANGDQVTIAPATEKKAKGKS
ncbi:MAG TPA: efflux RND transporter periplasmic adaptor subunit [Burkholderiales bacterium]|nr:efflux RND transporter periplasmic adaptor subunit [Burkholderiales bacterium]